jgi:hypothetical protein
MKNLVKTIIKGIRYSPKYGHHPGNGQLLFFSIISIAIILSGDIIFGCIFLGFFISLYLFGAYERGKY